MYNIQRQSMAVVRMTCCS